MIRHVGLYVVRTDQECTSSECRNTSARVSTPRTASLRSWQPES
jgi:hypothetical protein